MEKIFLSWGYIDIAIESLANQIKNSSFKPSYIKGIQRGGLIPAVLLSHRLNIPLVTNGILDNSVLVVDDICDSGKTIAEVQQYKCYTATIHHKQSAITKPDFFYNLIPDNKWVVYPWENLDSQTIPDYATKRK